MSIAENLIRINKTLHPNTKLIAVSKTYSSKDILEAYNAGQRIFGESKAQELQTKQNELPNDIEWHFIGHLQSNKVKYIAEFIHTIHSVDSLALLKEINKQAAKYKRIINCLLEVHISDEDSKFGLIETEIVELLKSIALEPLPHIVITGLMGMATYTNDVSIIRKEFKTLAAIKDKLITIFPNSTTHLNDLSMGMSGDYLIAMEEGSTYVRIGTSIFGKRDYSN